jgi:hypothetical protein
VTVRRRLFGARKRDRRVRNGARKRLLLLAVMLMTDWLVSSKGNER